MREVEGDLIMLALNGEFDVVVHGCNCFCTMGAGIAKAIKSEFPEVFEADKTTEKGSKEKLGTYSQVTITKDGKELTIINAYIQYNWRGRGVKADYDSIKRVFSKIKHEFKGKRIAYPLIGAGLAGGDWNLISEIITTELANENHTLVRFSTH